MAGTAIGIMTSITSQESISKDVILGNLELEDSSNILLEAGGFIELE